MIPDESDNKYPARAQIYHRRAAILDPITKSMTPDERGLKSVLIMYFEPKALHAQFLS
jgi:hypothetical protein